MTLFSPLVLVMAVNLPKVHILGHSFDKHLSRDISRGSNDRTDFYFGLQGCLSVHFYGVSGRTVDKLHAFNLGVIHFSAPEIVILEIGTNDLANLPPEVIGSALDDLIQLLLSSFPVHVVGWCYVIPRGLSHPDSALFRQGAEILNNYVSVVLDSTPNVFCWHHRVFNHPAKDYYLPDGVHLNSAGQYHLYRSSRRAILKASSYL